MCQEFLVEYGVSEIGCTDLSPRFLKEMSLETLICQACHSDKVRKEFCIDKRPFYRCKCCKTLFCLFEKETPNLSDYHNEKTAEQYSLYYNNLRKNQSNCILSQLKKIHRGKNKLLDVGCGNGVFVKESLEFGYDSIGIDVSMPPKAHLQAPEYLYKKTLETVVQTGEKFDIVSILNVLEHIAHPDIFLESITKMLNENSTIVISMPLSTGVVYQVCEFAFRFLGLKSPWLTILQWHTSSPHVFLPTLSGINAMIFRHFATKVVDLKPQKIVDASKISERIKLEKQQRYIGFLEEAMLYTGGKSIAWVGAFANLAGKPDEVFFFIQP